MDRYEQYKALARKQLETVPNIDMDSVDYYLEDIAKMWDLYEEAKAHDGLYLLSKVESTTFYNMITAQFFIKNLSEMDKTERCQNGIAKELVQSKINNIVKYMTQEELDDLQNDLQSFNCALNVATNYYVQPIYDKSNFRTYWEDVDMSRLNGNKELIESIYFEMHTRSAYTTARSTIKDALAKTQTAEREM